MLKDFAITKPCMYVDINLKLRFLIKSGYYIVPSPSTALPCSLSQNL